MENAFTRLDRVRIRSTGSYVPKRVLPNEEVVARIGTAPEWIVENLGIHERHIAEPDERTSDLAAQAGLRAITSGGLEANDIDLLIVATSTPDRKSPSAACLAQAKMGITNSSPAFDLAAVCSGFLYGLVVAGQFVQNGAVTRALVIGADTFSKITDWDHRNCVFFGDGAGAVVLERTEKPDGLLSAVLHADGRGANGFTVLPQKETFTMDGRAVFETATTAIPAAVRELLSFNGLDMKDVSMVVPHQPSLRVLKRTAEVLEVPFSLFRTNMDRHANTAAATVPLLLDQLNQRGEIRVGDLLLFAAVGAGWTWGAALYRWS